MKLQIEAPSHLIDVNGLALAKIEATPDGGLRIGALVPAANLAADARVRYGILLARALLARRLGTTAQQGDVTGNLLQRTRCPYFMTPTSRAISESPGGGCAATQRRSRQLTNEVSEACIAAHRRHGGSDDGARRGGGDCAARRRHIPIADFYRLPGETPTSRQCWSRAN